MLCAYELSHISFWQIVLLKAKVHHYQMVMEQTTGHPVCPSVHQVQMHPETFALTLLIGLYAATGVIVIVTVISHSSLQPDGAVVQIKSTNPLI